MLLIGNVYIFRYMSVIVLFIGEIGGGSITFLLNKHHKSRLYGFG